VLDGNVAEACLHLTAMLHKDGSDPIRDLVIHVVSNEDRPVREIEAGNILRRIEPSFGQDGRFQPKIALQGRESFALA